MKFLQDMLDKCPYLATAWAGVLAGEPDRQRDKNMSERFYAEGYK